MPSLSANYDYANVDKPPELTTNPLSQFHQYPVGSEPPTHTAVHQVNVVHFVESQRQHHCFYGRNASRQQLRRVYVVMVTVLNPDWMNLFTLAGRSFSSDSKGERNLFTTIDTEHNKPSKHISKGLVSTVTMCLGS